MTTDLEARLREALRDDAQRARLVNPNRPPAPNVVPISETPSRAHSGRRLVAVAATIALIAAAGVALVQIAGNRTTDVTTTPGPGTTTSPSLATNPPGPTRLFTDIQPGATAPLPPAPISARTGAAVVWTGKELIVWSGSPTGPAPATGDGAALDLTTGKWRSIATSPIGARDTPAAVWTGTEMIVVGGNGRQRLRSGAAYSPTTDKWRVLPDAPVGIDQWATAVWTGEEVLVLGGERGNAAYDPSTNEWRRLADGPQGVEQAVWTGKTVLANKETTEPSSEDGRGRALVQYDPSTDTWRVDGEASYAELVGVPDDHGVTRSVIGLPLDTGAPVDVLDDTGEVVGHLPAFPGKAAVFGDHIEAGGIWVGDEALIGISDGSLFPTSETWAFNPGNETWRRVRTPIDSPMMTIGDMLLVTSESTNNDITRASLYRPPMTATR